MPAKKKLNILAIDIGGSHIKAIVLDEQGKALNDYTKVETPPTPTPEDVLSSIQQLIEGFPKFDRISTGFPGYVKNGIVMTAPNLGTAQWTGTDLKKMLEKTLGKPARVVNDADMHGLGVVKGKGFELVVTLGTGFGTALFLDGKLLPHLELAHHPVTGKKDYDQYIGDDVLPKIGVTKWNERMQRVLGILKTVFNYDTLYLGGGNVKKINFTLDENIKVISNREGIKGGARLWA